MTSAATRQPSSCGRLNSVIFVDSRSSWTFICISRSRSRSWCDRVFVGLELRFMSLEQSQAWVQRGVEVNPCPRCVETARSHGMRPMSPPDSASGESASAGY
jgi:hypothetical protein